MRRECARTTWLSLSATRAALAASSDGSPGIRSMQCWQPSWTTPARAVTQNNRVVGKLPIRFATDSHVRRHVHPVPVEASPSIRLSARIDAVAGCHRGPARAVLLPAPSKALLRRRTHRALDLLDAGRGQLGHGIAG